MILDLESTTYRSDLDIGELNIFRSCSQYMGALPYVELAHRLGPAYLEDLIAPKTNRETDYRLIFCASVCRRSGTAYREL